MTEKELGDDVQIGESCLEKCPWHAIDATSKAEDVDLLDVLADVSTYRTAPQCLDVASACLNEIEDDALQVEDLKSDLHPTNTIGIEGHEALNAGTQFLAVLNKDDLEDTEKQRRKASACSLPLFFTPLSPLPPSVPCLIRSSLSLVSQILYMVFSPLTSTIFSASTPGRGEHT